MIRNWIIYKITSPSGRVYIGRTCNPKKRLRHYQYGDHKGQTRISASIMKYGWDKHLVETIDSFSGTNGFAAGKEIFWIRSYMCNYSKWPYVGGLNLTDGGEGFLGYKLTDAQRIARSEWAKQYFMKNGGTNKGRQMSEEQKKFLSGYYKKHSHFYKMKGIKQSKAHVAKIVATRKANGSYGHSEETKTKMSAAHAKHKIIAHSVDGSFLKEFSNVSEASIELGVPKPTIHAIANGTTKKPRKYIFKYSK